MTKAVTRLRSPLVAAAASGLWMVAMMPTVEPYVWLIVPVGMIGSAIALRKPVIGAVIILAASILSAAFRIEFGSVVIFLPQIGVMYLLGISSSAIPIGLLFVLGFSGAAGFKDGASPLAVILTALMFSVPYFFGRIVIKRTADAEVAAAESTRLANIDLEETLRFSRREHGAKVARDAIEVLREAIVEMRSLAAQALRRTPDEDGLDAIRERGASAITTLHSILELLDEHPGSRSKSTKKEPSSRRTAREFNHLRLDEHIIAVVGTILCASVALAVAEPNPWLIVIAFVLPPSAALVTHFPLMSGVLVGSAFLMLAFYPPSNSEALWPAGIFIAQLCWNLGKGWTRRHLIAFVFVAGGLFAVASYDGRQGIGYMAVLLLMILASSRAWHRKDMIVTQELTRSARISAHIAAQRARAEREERKQVARELHDGISWAITGMTLQALAARARIHTDPEAAAAHIETVRSVGTKAVADIDAITLSWQQADCSHVTFDIDALLAGARSLGQSVTLVGSTSACDRLVYRLIQESLTNVFRYARGARVTIEVGVDSGEQFVVVTDSGTHDDAGPATKSAAPSVGGTDGLGSGLAGLAERVRSRGGVFDASPLLNGFRVSARWPITQPVFDGTVTSTPLPNDAVESDQP